MNTVFNDLGGYTQEANNLDKEIRNAVKHIIQREIKNNTPIEVIEYVLFHGIAVELLYQKIVAKIDKKEEINNG